MSEQLPGKEKPDIHQNWATFIGRILGVTVASAITLLIVFVVIWALIKIGQDLRASL